MAKQVKRMPVRGTYSPVINNKDVEYRYSFILLLKKKNNDEQGTRNAEYRSAHSNHHS
jgi:hypothetical protein